MINVNKASDLTETQMYQLLQEAVSKNACYVADIFKGLIDTGNIEDARATVNGYAGWLIDKGILPETFVLDGVTKGWWRNGQLEYHQEYFEGNRHGVAKGWWGNGQLRLHQEYFEGNLHGVAKGWYEDGSLGHHQEWSEGTLVKEHLVDN